MRFLLLNITLACVLFSCGNPDDDLYKTAPQNKYIICRGSALYLNDGKRWVTNPETSEGIYKMIEQVNNFSVPADTTAYHALANDLITDYIYIINYCSFMGQSHELVHAYLFPLQELIVPMQIGGEITCENQYEKIKDHLDKFGIYFE